MMNPDYHFRRMRELLEEFEPSRERSLAQTKLDEAELWLTRCTPTREAVERDQATPALAEASAHPFTDECDGFHAAGDDDACNLPAAREKDDPAERADVQRMRREMAREAGDDGRLDPA